MDLAQLTKETFESLVGSEFTVKLADGQQVRLTLARVFRVMERVQSKRLKREPFSMFFEAPDTFYLPQNMYPFSHPTFDRELPIFIVPVGREDGKFVYEAIFT